jgi:hypothetical protein
VLCAYSCVVGLTISLTGPNDELRTGNPSVYDSLESATSFLPTALTVVSGHADIVRIIDPLASYPANLGVYGSYEPGRTPFDVPTQPEEIDVIAPSSGAYVFGGEFVATSAVPSGAHIGITLVVGAKEITVHPSPREQHFILDLSRGLNRIEITSTTSATLPPGASTELVSVTSLHIEHSPSASACSSRAACSGTG